MGLQNFEELKQLRELGVSKAKLDVCQDFSDQTKSHVFVTEVEFYQKENPIQVTFEQNPEAMELTEKSVKVERSDLDETFLTDPYEFESQIAKKENE